MRELPFLTLVPTVLRGCLPFLWGAPMPITVRTTLNRRWFYNRWPANSLLWTKREDIMCICVCKSLIISIVLFHKCCWFLVLFPTLLGATLLTSHGNCCTEELYGELYGGVVRTLIVTATLLAAAFPQVQMADCANNMCHKIHKLNCEFYNNQFHHARTNNLSVSEGPKTYCSCFIMSNFRNVQSSIVGRTV